MNKSSRHADRRSTADVVSGDERREDRKRLGTVGTHRADITRGTGRRHEHESRDPVGNAATRESASKTRPPRFNLLVSRAQRAAGLIARDSIRGLHARARGKPKTQDGQRRLRRLELGRLTVERVLPHVAAPLVTLETQDRQELESRESPHRGVHCVWLRDGRQRGAPPGRGHVVAA